MGYFANGTEEMMYSDRYCDKCKHDKDGNCPIRGAHFIFNYDECNKPESILHMLIPRSEDGENEQCYFFEEEKEVVLK